MDMVIFQNIFTGKPFFDHDRFMSEVLSERLKSALADGVLSGFGKTRDTLKDGEHSLTAFALILHEKVFNATIDALHRRIPADQMVHNQVRYGNERLHFSYMGYCFIFRMAGSGRNDTERERLIQNQEAEQHVISIVYRLDALRESVSSLCLQYEKGGNVVWECPIPLGIPVVGISDVNLTAGEAVKPRLKRLAVEKSAE